MIEVEKKFIPTEENLKILLIDAEFLGEIINHDVYYDYPDYRFLKGDIALRNRNGNFELKIKSEQGAHKEIENKKEIERYFQVNSLEDFIKENLIEIINFKNTRKKYKKEDFIIDVDETDFGYKVGEIEILVSSIDEVSGALDKIEIFAKNYNIDLGKNLSKKKAYLKNYKIDLYKELYESR